MRRLAVAVDLVNAAGADLGPPWPAQSLADAGYRAPESDAEWIDLLRGIRGLSELIMLIADGAEGDAVASINAQLIALRVVPRLEEGQQGAWELHFHALDAGFADGWASGIVAALALACAAGESGRIGRCQAAGCEFLFLDRGRNMGRRFCGIRCQNRAKSASYRERQRHR